jgi:dual specificity tyrosine-phosphorylation-regulated kinase 2/3/4
VDDEEAQGDEEMMHYIRRQQAKKMASGATQEELDELLNFPEPLPPGTPSTPAGSSFRRYYGLIVDHIQKF